MSGMTPGFFGAAAETQDEFDWNPSFDSLGGWQDFDLMPPEYRAERQARLVVQRWAFVLVILFLVAIGSLITLWIQGQNTLRRNEQLLAKAEPLSKIRQRAQILEAENVLLSKWCSWVESAKPDDSLVQVLTAATLATQDREPQPEQQHLDVQSIEVKLPREYDPKAVTPPSWSEPKFALTVTARSRDILMPWRERLESTGRLESVKLVTPGGVWREALIQVNAKPLSTRTVP